MSQSKHLRVFVYGTLKHGEPNHHWLTDTKNGISNFVSPGRTTKIYPLVIGTRYNIPFLLDKEGVGHNVQGEIYEIDEKMLSNLDILEDYPTYYDRRVEEITTPNLGTVSCWIYLIKVFPDRLLAKQMLESYKDTPEKPYCESYEADLKADVKSVCNVLKELSWEEDR